MTAPLRVLFVCIGNSCRSQMAEGFAKCYGSDVLSVESAGLAPASIIVPATFEAMREKNIMLDGQFPKCFDVFHPEMFDVIINMSGRPMPPGFHKLAEEWPVKDPIGFAPEQFRVVRDEIETRVMRLILGQRIKVNQRSGVR